MTSRTGWLVVLAGLALAWRPAVARAEGDGDDTKADDTKADDDADAATGDEAKADAKADAKPAQIEELVAEPKIEPPKRIAASGFFAEAGLGAVAFLPKTSTDAAIGPALQLRLGYDLFSWFSVGIFVAASNHEATVPPPPEGEWFQLYRGGADGRLGGRIERIAFFIEGGAGLAMISSNVLQKVMITDPGEKYSITFHGGGGLEYQLENRHYAFGVGVDGFLVPQFATMKAIDSRLYLRYTYGGG
jgi:hypothetical protein